MGCRPPPGSPTVRQPPILASATLPAARQTSILASAALPDERQASGTRKTAALSGMIFFLLERLRSDPTERLESKLITSDLDGLLVRIFRGTVLMCHVTLQPDPASNKAGELRKCGKMGCLHPPGSPTARQPPILASATLPAARQTSILASAALPDAR